MSLKDNGKKKYFLSVVATKIFISLLICFFLRECEFLIEKFHIKNYEFKGKL